MARTVKCHQCKKEIKDDECYYIGPKKPHCSVKCAETTISDSYLNSLEKPQQTPRQNRAARKK